MAGEILHIRKRKKTVPAKGHQCDSCQVYRCPESRQAETARMEIAALINDTAFRCEDYEANYWEQVNER
jgi:hypothetical protein